MAGKRPRSAFESDLQAHHSPYAIYGTPLPPLDPGTRDDGSYVPIWKQEVTDDRGRKRIHGAFTGGFSAGYFNTVGSKEGWTPATFVSSRQNRAAAKPQQRREDFMDEEDIREAEESRILQTTDSFAGFSSTDPNSTRERGLMDLFLESSETIGVKLLKRMGWKEGQGIGPMVRRLASLDDGPTERREEPGETYLFAPEDTPIIAFIKKNDRKGLGFEGEARLDPRENDRNDSEDSDAFFGRRLASQSTRKYSKVKEPYHGAFGVGVLNDTGSDDEDPFSLGPPISYNRVIGGNKRMKKITKTTVGSSNPLLNAKPVFISKKAASQMNSAGFRRCHDGRLPLEGFLLAVDMSSLSVFSEGKTYSPPEIPRGWKSSKAPSGEQSTQKYVSTKEAAKSSSLDPISRAKVLGEAQLPGKSVFDWMTPEAREKIVKLTGRTDLPPALGEKAPKGYELSDSQRDRDLWNLVPSLDKQVAVQALTRAVGGWMPYAEDEGKRLRYRTFLEVRAGLRDTLPDRQPGSSTDEWVTELHEFSRAAEVFRPVSGLMASRFTSSSIGPKEASDSLVPTSDGPLSKPGHQTEDPALAAAEIGMFGPMTRSEIPFYPNRLLCKRFNTKPPADVQGDPGERPRPGISTGRFQSAGYQATGPKELVSKDIMNRLILETGGLRPDASSPVDSRSPIMIKPEQNEALEADRPGDAVFKAIFGSDDEE